MIRRPLWNRGGGVFVEEAGWWAAGREASATLADPALIGGRGVIAAAADEAPRAGVAGGPDDSSPARWVHVRIVTER